MESLFKLFVVRPPPVLNEDPSKSLPLAQDSPFQRSLQAITGTNIDGEAKTKAREYAQNRSLYFRAEGDVRYAAQLRRLAVQLDELADRAQKEEDDNENENEDDEDDEDDEEPSQSSIDLREEISKLVSSIFGVGQPQDIVQKLQDAVPLLKDTIIVIKRLPEEHFRPIEVFTRQLLDIDFLAQVARSESFPKNVAEMESFRNRPLRIPSVLELDAIRRRAKDIAKHRFLDKQIAFDKIKTQAVELNDKYIKLESAIKELRTIAPEHLVDPPKPPSIPAFEPPEQLLPETLALKRLDLVNNLVSTNQKLFETAISMAQKSPGSVDPARILDATGSSSAVQLAEKVLQEHKALVPQFRSRAWNPPEKSEPQVLFKSSLMEDLSKPTTELVQKLRIPVTTQGLDRTIKKLNGQVDEIKKEFNALVGPQGENLTLSRFGDHSVLVRSSLPPMSTRMGFGIEDIISQVSGSLEQLNDALAMMGRIQPSGEADLLIVKQQLMRYEGGDVAHVENILKGEKKKRETSIKNVTETYSFLETESTEEKSKAQESTERFETSREAQLQIQKESAAQASATVTGSYGPFVSFSASIAGQKKDAQQSAITTASKEAKDIVNKSTEKITKRILERTARTITSTVSELNSHEINNSFEDIEKPEHIAGVYQWVNKVYQARVHNYGLRKMYDFMIPEPAAFYIFSKVNRRADPSAITELKMPPELKHTPETIKETNVQELAVHYGVDPTTLPAHPPSFTWVHHGAKGTLLQGNWAGFDVVTITIPEGYACVRLHVTYVDAMNWQGAVIVFGNDSIPVEGFDGFRGQTSNDIWMPLTLPVEGMAPLSISISGSYKIEIDSPYAWQVGFYCQDNGAEKKWQNTVWRLFKTAVDTAWIEYNAKVAELKASAAAASRIIQIEGTNPAENLVTMRDEIKRSCISIMTNSSFEGFDAVDAPIPRPVSAEDTSPDPSTFPRIDIPRSFDEGSLVLFFEQAFEWMNMTYTLYPYFWARKSTWLDRISYDDPDPLFNRFLKAGYARVTLPVRPGFATAIAHYLDFGEQWRGGALPPIGSDMYLSVAEETMEETGRPQKEYGPPSEPWDVVVPTTLIKLRPDDELPRWKEKSEGKWVEMVKRNGNWEEVNEITT